MNTSKQLLEIEILQKECEQLDGIQLKLNWSMLRNQSDETKVFLQYEDEQLVGFLGVYGFGNKYELCGMVKQSYRRKGIFTKLLSDAIKMLSGRKVTEILLNAPSNSNSAKGFLQKVTCDYAFSEYQMQWHETEISLNDEVILRPSTIEDAENLIQLDVKCFGFSEEDAREYFNQNKDREERGLFMIEQEGKTVGKIRVSHNDKGEAWVYGFAVFPEYQGQGIGRKVLTNVVLAEHQKSNPIFLEVEAKNANALKLYESCGFRSYYSQDYYELRK